MGQTEEGGVKIAVVLLCLLCTRRPPGCTSRLRITARDRPQHPASVPSATPPLLLPPWPDSLSMASQHARPGQWPGLRALLSRFGTRPRKMRCIVHCYYTCTMYCTDIVCVFVCIPGHSLSSKSLSRPLGTVHTVHVYVLRPGRRSGRHETSSLIQVQPSPQTLRDVSSRQLKTRRTARCRFPHHLVPQNRP